MKVNCHKLFNDPERSYQEGHKDGAKAVFDLLIDDANTRIEFVKEKYPSVIEQLREWGIK